MKLLNRNDRLLAAGIFLIAILLFAGRLMRQSAGSEIEILMDGESLGIYSLDQDQTIEIGGTNRVVIAEGKARMEWADCPDQLCVHMNPIAKSGETLVCLPNEVIVRVVRAKEEAYDAISG